MPASWGECRERGWNELDVLLITGDAYIDHPSFGVALIGRLLEQNGCRVAVLAQPHYDTDRDFKQFPAPLLFVGITAGNLDSIVANYTGHGKVRDTDAYSPDGNPWRGQEKVKNQRRRPDRATLIYTSLARSNFSPTPIVLGGIEASLRRFVHYDFKQDKLRASVLTDAKADLLVYGMGEKAVLEIARRRKKGLPLDDIPGTCRRHTESEIIALYGKVPATSTADTLLLPSYTELSNEKRLFLEAEISIDRHSRSSSSRLVLQRQQSHWVVQNPPAEPLKVDELDALYELPFTRKPHPRYRRIPAFSMIKDSVTIVRGCSGNCSFCAITRHQGPHIISRSSQSIVDECQLLAAENDFSGTISDLGGPTANLYGTGCNIGNCKKRDCLFPGICPHLKIDEDRFLALLDKVSAITNVNNVFISSGLRMELLLQTPRLFEKILRNHTPGALKIAPEHTVDELLSLMHKEPHELLLRFVNECRKISCRLGKKRVELSPYIITSHPGSTEKHAQQLLKDLQGLRITLHKFQDFTPTPGTLSTAMFVTGLNPDTKKPIPVSRTQSARLKERRIIEGLLQRKKAGKYKKK